WDEPSRTPPNGARVKKTTSRVLAAAAMTSLTTLGLMGGLTAPANATDTRCSSGNSKEFPTNGFNADVKITMCLYRNWSGPGGSDETKWAEAHVSWGDSGSGKFENFDVQVRIEQNDAVIKSGTCDL